MRRMGNIRHLVIGVLKLAFKIFLFCFDCFERSVILILMDHIQFQSQSHQKI